MPTATADRIRRCNRDSEFAIIKDDAVLAARVDARPVGDDDYTIDSFFDRAAHAQVFLNERFGIMSKVRLNEAAETAQPLRIGIDVPLAPVLPWVRMRDRTRGIDARMLITGLAVDMQVDRNSIETVGVNV